MGVLTKMVEASQTAAKQHADAAQAERVRLAQEARRLTVPVFIDRVKTMLDVKITAKQTAFDVVDRGLGGNGYITTEIDGLLVGMSVPSRPGEKWHSQYVWLYLFPRCPFGHTYTEHMPFLRADEPQNYPHVLARAYSEQERLATSCKQCKAEDLKRTTRQEFDALLAHASVQEIRAMLATFTASIYTDGAALRRAMDAADKVRQICPRCGGPHALPDCGVL